MSNRRSKCLPRPLGCSSMHEVRTCKVSHVAGRASRRLVKNCLQSYPCWRMCLTYMDVPSVLSPPSPLDRLLGGSHLFYFFRVS